MKQISKDIEKKYQLFHQKNQLLRELDEYLENRSLKKIIKTLNQLHKTITKEVLINQKFLNKLRFQLRLFNFKKIKTMSIKRDVERLKLISNVILNKSSQLSRILNKQLVELSKLNHISILFNYFFKRTKYKKTMNYFKELHKEEIKIYSTIHKDAEEHLIQLNRYLKQYKKQQEELRKERKLVQKLVKAYRELLQSVGDVKEVTMKSKEVEFLIKKVQMTILYNYIEDDVKKIKTKVIYIKDHPKENKLAYALATAYIVLPTTFEITFVVLTLRYTIKYLTDINKRKVNHI